MSAKLKFKSENLGKGNVWFNLIIENNSAIIDGIRLLFGNNLKMVP